MGFIISKSLCIAVQGGYFFMHKTIIVTNKVKQIMYSTQTPPFIRVVLRPPPVAEKGSLALSEITSIRKCIYAQRDTTIFQTGQPPPFPYRVILTNILFVFKTEVCVLKNKNSVCKHTPKQIDIIKN